MTKLIARARVSIIAPPLQSLEILIEIMIHWTIIFVDVSMADQVEHLIHSVQVVLPDSRVVSSNPRSVMT